MRSTLVEGANENEMRQNIQSHFFFGIECIVKNGRQSEFDPDDPLRSVNSQGRTAPGVNRTSLAVHNRRDSSCDVNYEMATEACGLKGSIVVNQSDQGSH